METTAKSESLNPLLAKISSKLGGWHDRNGLVLLEPISISVPQSESNDRKPLIIVVVAGASSTNVSRSRSGLIVIMAAPICTETKILDTSLKKHEIDTLRWFQIFALTTGRGGERRSYTVVKGELVVLVSIAVGFITLVAMETGRIGYLGAGHFRDVG